MTYRVTELVSERAAEYKQFVADFMKNNNMPEFSELQVDYILAADMPLHNLQEAIEQNKYRFYVAIDNETDRIIAFSHCRNAAEGVGFVYWLGVHPDHQQKGAARALLLEYEEYLRKGYGHMYELYAAHRNVPIYEKLGFSVVCKRYHVYFGKDMYLLEKRLGKWSDDYIRDYFRTKEQ
jgi:ribosomal protein S18 acetylase RimI-like enzyme